MPQNPNYIPGPDADAGTWADNFNTLLTASPTTYGRVSGDATAVNAVVGPWLAALALATNPATRTPVAVAAKDDARAAMESVVRPIATDISNNPSVLNSDKTAIGVTVRIQTRTRNSIVSTPIELVSEVTSNNQVQLRLQNPDTPLTKARPLGAIGGEIEIEVRIGTGPDVWQKVSGAVITRPVFLLDTAGMTGAAYRWRGRWLGALLPGGAANVGVFSAYQNLSIPR